jgi:glycine oxidase
MPAAPARTAQGRASIRCVLNGQPTEVVVVGGGIIGLAVAWRLRQRGISVELLERGGTGEGTSRVAAGMLAPVAEVEFGEAGRRVLELGLRSASLWPGFVAELREAAGVELELLRTGTLLLARDEDEARELERQLAFRNSLGLRVQRLRASQARELEPALAPTVRLALEIPDDHSVDPRAVLAALRRACLAAGVRLREQAEVMRVELDDKGERVAGLTLAGGQRIAAEEIVLAAGPWSAGLGELPERARVPVRPVRGQLLRLRDPAGPGLTRRALRFEGGYLLSRGDGRYVLGATVEERGFALSATVGGIHELLREAHELVPGVAELEVEELCVGLRPGTPDNAPLIGPGAIAGLTWATGHYRSGILLAPLTAALVADLLAPTRGAGGGEGAAEDARLVAACAPDRFAGRAADEDDAVVAANAGGAA